MICSLTAAVRLETCKGECWQMLCLLLSLSLNLVVIEADKGLQVPLLDYPTIRPVLLQLCLHRSAHNVIALLYEKHRFELVH